MALDYFGSLDAARNRAAAQLRFEAFAQVVRLVVSPAPVHVHHYPRCDNAQCRRVLAEYLTVPYSLRCRRCGYQCKRS